MRVFLDANILFSAANAASPLRRLLHEIRQRGDVVSSAGTIDEATRNIAVKRPEWRGGLQRLVETLSIVPAAECPARVKLVDKDRHLLGAAVAAGCAHLVTGDQRHFGHLFGESISGVKVVSPVMLARELARS